MTSSHPLEAVAAALNPPAAAASRSNNQPSSNSAISEFLTSFNVTRNEYTSRRSFQSGVLFSFLVIIMAAADLVQLKIDGTINTIANAWEADVFIIIVGAIDLVLTIIVANNGSSRDSLAILHQLGALLPSLFSLGGLMFRMQSPQTAPIITAIVAALAKNASVSFGLIKHPGETQHRTENPNTARRNNRGSEAERRHQADDIPSNQQPAAKHKQHIAKHKPNKPQRQYVSFHPLLPSQKPALTRICYRGDSNSTTLEIQLDAERFVSHAEFTYILLTISDDSRQVFFAREYPAQPHMSTPIINSNDQAAFMCTSHTKLPDTYRITFRLPTTLFQAVSGSKDLNVHVYGKTRYDHKSPRTFKVCDYKGWLPNPKHAPNEHVRVNIGMEEMNANGDEEVF